ncbi:MAG: hypothetical protein H6700_10360 [Myxococcales bacterium]|nr:hypothetical protein [Myxococcales bacterium]
MLRRFADRTRLAALVSASLVVGCGECGGTAGVDTAAHSDPFGGVSPLPSANPVDEGAARTYLLTALGHVVGAALVAKNGDLEVEVLVLRDMGGPAVALRWRGLRPEPDDHLRAGDTLAFVASARDVMRVRPDESLSVWLITATPSSAPETWGAESIREADLHEFSISSGVVARGAMFEKWRPVEDPRRVEFTRLVVAAPAAWPPEPAISRATEVAGPAVCEARSMTPAACEAAYMTAFAASAPQAAWYDVVAERRDDMGMGEVGWQDTRRPPPPPTSAVPDVPAAEAAPPAGSGTQE